MYITDQFIDVEGIHALFPRVPMDQMREMFSANVFGVPSNFAGSNVVDRKEAERAANAIFKKQEEPKTEEPKVNYTPTQQRDMDNAQDILRRYGDSNTQENRLRCVFAKRTIAKIEKATTPKVGIPTQKDLEDQLHSLEMQHHKIVNDGPNTHGGSFHQIGVSASKDLRELQRVKEQIRRVRNNLQEFYGV